MVNYIHYSDSDFHMIAHDKDDRTSNPKADSQKYRTTALQLDVGKSGNWVGKSGDRDIGKSGPEVGKSGIREIGTMACIMKLQNIFSATSICKVTTPPKPKTNKIRIV